MSKMKDKDFIEVYKATLGSATMKSIAERWECSVSSIRRYAKKGCELLARDTGKTDTKVIESGVNGLTLEQIKDIQKRVKDDGQSQLSVVKELGLSRYKVKKALEVKLEDHKNNVTAAVVEKVGYEALRIGVAFKHTEREMIMVVIARDGESITAVDTNIKLSNYVEQSMRYNLPAPITESTERIVIKNPEFEVVGGCEEVATIYDLACRIVENKAGFYLNDGTLVTVDEACGLDSVEEDNVIFGVAHKESGVFVQDPYIWDISVGNTLGLHGVEDFVTLDTHGFKKDLRIEDHIGKKLVANQSKYRAMVLPNQVTIVVDNQPLTIPNGHQNFKKVLDAVKEERWEDAIKYINVGETIKEFVDGLFELKGGVVYFEGIRLEHAGMTSRILSMAADGDRDGVQRAARFINKVMENPSNKIVKRIFDFMKFADVEIADDGDLYAYKAVRGDYLDCHSRSIKNTPGSVVTMRRNRVNEDDEQTCSYGLHVCALSYLPNYSGSGISSNRIVRVKLNPSDIVSIPVDYKDAKIRCCRYEVVNDVSQEYRQGKLRIDRDGIFEY